MIANCKFPAPGRPLVFLIGMPGAGKTFWGKKLAARYAWQFIDLDVAIEEREKASVSELFGQFGEDGFRIKEHQQLVDTIKEQYQPAVIACGGGTPCFYNNLEIMKQAGIAIYLQEDVATLAERLKAGTHIRPLLKNKNGLHRHLQTLLQQRMPIYEQATIILPAEDISFTTFDQIINTCTDRH